MQYQILTSQLQRIPSSGFGNNDHLGDFQRQQYATTGKIEPND